MGAYARTPPLKYATELHILLSRIILLYMYLICKKNHLLCQVYPVDEDIFSKFL
jgi:hypothetical protein